MAGEGDGEDDLINRILVACDPEYWATLDKELQATLDKKFQQRGLALLPAMIFLFGTHEINPGWMHLRSHLRCGFRVATVRRLSGGDRFVVREEEWARLGPVGDGSEDVVEDRYGTRYVELLIHPDLAKAEAVLSGADDATDVDEKRPASDRTIQVAHNRIFAEFQNPTLEEYIRQIKSDVAPRTVTRARCKEFWSKRPGDRHPGPKPRNSDQTKK
jgi:hypothetical protein